MVHALEEIHRLLQPGGYLIDIHPARVVTQIEVRRGGVVTFCEPVSGETFEDIGWAEDALAQVTRDGLFTVEQADEFDWRIYASSVAELCDYIVQVSTYSEGTPFEVAALQEPGMAARVQGALQAAGVGAEVVCFIRICITRLGRGGRSRVRAAG